MAFLPITLRRFRAAAESAGRGYDPLKTRNNFFTGS
jgi:hypothetical protein